MRTQQKAQLTFGDLVAAAYELWGKGQAERMVRLAIFARVVKFRAQSRSFISLTDGKTHDY